jgi:CSLREA domain-containing protein
MSAVVLASPAQAANTYIVNSTNDVNDGTCDPTHCSLREAITAANGAAGSDTISFDISGAGPHTIAPLAAFPTITSPVIIDGTTEPDYQVGLPVVELTGVNRTATQFWSGFEITAGGSTIKGLVINRFFRGIRMQTAGGNTISGNFLGTTSSGLAAAGNQAMSLDVFTSNNTIGGTTTADRNVLAASGNGVVLQSTANGNSVLNNYIGTDRLGTTKLSNGGSVTVSGDNNVIGAPSDGNVIAGSIDSGSGAVELGTGADGNIVAGNYIGVDATGDTPMANNGPGVRVWSSGNTIGGSAAGAGNVISANATQGSPSGGIQIMGPNTIVQGNYIGTDASGEDPLGNWGPGIFVNSSANVIGGSAPGAGNVISANTGAGGFQANGIDFSGSGATNNTVQGNFIGTDVTGTQALGNSHRGIMLNAAPNNQIGGTVPGSGNLISGNAWEAIGVNSSGNAIQGNRIGTDANGETAIPSPHFGIALGGSNNLVGGTAAGAGNLISGHTNAPAMTVSGDSHTIQGNKIGTDVSGQSPIPNQAGVEMFFGTNNVIGGEAAGAGNTIAFNTTFGVRVAGTGHKILGNSIHTNGGSSSFWRGIHLGNNVPPNDPGDGDTGNNNLQNFPTLTSVTSNPTATVDGTLSTAPNMTYRVEFFGNTQCHPSGFGEGRTYLGFLDVPVDGSGIAPFSFDAGNALTPGDFVTATATDPSGNTSEFSACKRYNRPPVLNAIGNKTVGEFNMLSFSISGSDPDGNTLTYSASGLPQGAVFNPSTKTFDWFPTYSQAGTYENVRFEVSDGNGGTDYEEITITVTNTNRAPVLTSVDDKQVAEGSELLFSVAATDPDGDSVAYSSPDLPSGATLDPSTGAFSWTPDFSQAGDHQVTFVASDGTLSDSESITITVTDTDNEPPAVSLEEPIVPFMKAKSFRVSWSATDDKSGVASYDIGYREPPNSAVAGLVDWLTDVADSAATFVGQPGHSYCFSARATDGAGNTSDYSSERCTTVPLDDVALKKSSQWARKKGRGYYLNTFTLADDRGAVLSKQVTANRLALLATRCPGCGVVKVFLGQTQLKKISLNATKVMKKQLIPIKNFASPTSGRLRIVIASDGKPVRIEGLGVARIDG